MRGPAQQGAIVPAGDRGIAAPVVEPSVEPGPQPGPGSPRRGVPRLLAGRPAGGGEERQPGDAKGGGEGGRYEEISVRDAKLVKKGLNAPKITFKAVNNTKQALLRTTFRVTGTYGILDEYGDLSEEEDQIDVFLVQSGDLVAPCLLPGETELELVPSSSDGVVVSYRGRDGEEQTFELGDLRSFEVSAGDSLERADPDDTGILDEGEYEVGLKIRGSVDKLVAEVTNRSDHRWREVRVYTVAVGKDGALAKRTGYSVIDDRYVRPVTVTFLKPGETKSESVGIRNELVSYDIDHFEVLRVEADREDGE
ncbi:MAG: hypothetical protein SOY67_03560 [Collinsella sp.]|nr:hypothetical protein [Collinsella sp.]